MAYEDVRDFVDCFVLMFTAVMILYIVLCSSFSSLLQELYKVLSFSVCL